jgi:hypothetical protein
VKNAVTFTSSPQHLQWINPDSCHRAIKPMRTATNAMQARGKSTWLDSDKQDAVPEHNIT